MPRIHIVPAMRNQGTHLTTQQKMRLKKACREFESILVGYMFKSMRETVPKSGLFDESGITSESMFRGMLDQEMAKEFCLQDKIGLADEMFKQLTQPNLR